MADTETVRILRIRGQTEGLSEMSAKLKDIKAAQEGVAQLSGALAAATETSAKRQLSSAGAWDRLIQKYDGASKAQAMFERELHVANRAFDAGKASADAYVRTVEQMKRAYESFGAAAKSASSIDQSGLNRTIGIKVEVSGSARDSAAAMEAEFSRLDQVAQAKAAQIGAEFGRELSERLIAGTGKAARDSASAFSEELDRIDKIARMKAEQTGAEFGRALNASLIKGQGKSASESASVFVEQENAIQKLRVEFDQLSVAQERRAASEAQINKFASAGLIGEQQRITMLDAVNRRYEDTAAALARTQVPLGKYVSGVGLARNEIINLSRQAQDVFVSLASGQSPLTVLIQQGTQIADVFAASRGSVGGFLVQLMAWLGPLVPAIAAASTAIAGLYAAFNVAGQRQDLSNSLLGVGRAAGVTGEEMNRLAIQAAASADTTVTAARSIAAEFAKTGTIASSNLSRLTLLTKNYAATTGQDMGTAAKELASALADPSRGAETLNSKLGFLDSTTARAIRTATDYGDKLRAQKLLLDAVADSTVRAESTQSKFNQAWERYITRPIDAAKEGLGNAIIGADQRESIKLLDDQLKSLRTTLNSVTSGSEGVFQERQRNAIAAVEARKAALESLIATQDREARAGQAKTESASKTRAADDLLQGVQKDQMAYQLAVRAVTVYEASIGELIKKRNELVAQGDLGQGLNQQKFGEINTQIREQTEGLERAKNQVKDYAVATQGLTVEQNKARLVDEIRLRAVNDITPAQRAATAAEIARIGQLGTATTAAERAAEAEKARRDVQIDAAKATADASRASNDNANSLNAQAEAARKSGMAAADAARLRQAASIEARGTGQSEQVVYERMLREALAETNKELSTKVAQNKEAASAERAANAQARASGLSEAQRADVLQRISAVQEARAKLIANGVTDERQLAQATAETTRAIVEKNSAEAQARALGMLYGQSEQIAGLEREIALVGQGRDVRRETLAVLQAEQDLRRANVAIGSEEGQEYINRAKRIEALRTQLDQTRKAYDGIKQAQDFVADGFKSFVEELITGTDGINGALKTLGKGFLSASLDAVISGKGPLAGITGLASNDNTKQGGVIGLLSGNNLKQLTDSVAKGAEKGSEAGTTSGFSLLSGAGGTGILGIDGKQFAAGATAIAGLAGAYGIGASASSTAMGVGGGALSGALGGAALGTAIMPGIGTAIGAIAGAIAGGGLGFLGGESASKKRKEELQKQAQENYKNAQADIASFRSQARGEPQDTLATRIRDAQTTARKLADVAYLAGKSAEADAIWFDGHTYAQRAMSEFRDGFGGLIDSLNSGLGPSSPFTSAKSTIKELGDELKAFIDNTKTAFGEGTPEVQQARESAVAYSLTVLNGSKALSMVGTRMQEISGTAAGLGKVLADLGVSSADAAAAINAGVVASIARLKTSFETDLTRKTFDAQDKGYINEASDLIAELASLRTDAATLGSNQGLVTDYFKASAQAIVDGAQLTGDAFDDLIRRFPELNGNVKAFEEAIDAASKTAEIAARRLGYQDRLFAALNDTTTLEGQLAAYDRTAMREREQEIKAGGEAILDLENAQLAERYNIIRDFNEAANDNYRQSLEQAQDYVAKFANSIREYLDGLRSGSDSPLSPQARLAAAQSQYNTQLGLAQGGNRDALDGITGYASDLLDAAKGFYASSSGFQAIFAQIQTQLGALPSQISAEQFIVNAINAGASQTTSAVNSGASQTTSEIAAMRDTLQASLQASINTGSATAIASALSTYFNKIDTNTDNTISFAEMASALGGMASNQALRDMFTRLDTDNSGSLSRLELIKNATGQTEAYSFQQKQTLDYLANVALVANNLQSSANSIADYSNNLGISQNSILTAIQGLQYTSSEQLQLLNGQLSTQTNVTVQGQTVYGNLVDNMRKVVYNTALANQRFSVQGNSPAVNYTFAQGGLVEGPGSGTSDSISARLSNGEFVMRAAAVDRFGVGMLDRMNDNFAMPAMAIPVPVGGGGVDIRAVVAGLKAVEIAVQKLEASNTRVTIAAAEHVGEEVKVVAAETRSASRRSMLDAA